MNVKKWIKSFLAIALTGSVLLFVLLFYVRSNWESSLKIRPVIMDSELISKNDGSHSKIYSELERKFSGQSISRIYKITSGPLENTYVITNETINDKIIGNKKLQFKGNARNRFGLDLATPFDGIILDGEHLQPNETLFACKHTPILGWGCSLL